MSDDFPQPVDIYHTHLSLEIPNYRLGSKKNQCQTFQEARSSTRSVYSLCFNKCTIGHLKKYLDPKIISYPLLNKL